MRVPQPPWWGTIVLVILLILTCALYGLYREECNVLVSGFAMSDGCRL